MKISLDPRLLAASNNKLALGVLTIKGAKVTKIDDSLWALLQDAGKKLAESSEDAINNTPIDALNNTYKNLGLKLADYKGSNEAFLKRIRSGKGVYQINNIVDANNLVSVLSLRSIGSYDLSKITGDIVFRPGNPDERYPSTKGRALKLEKLPVLCDDQGPFGSPTSDSERALITDSTTDLMIVIYSFDGLQGLQENMEMMAQLLTTYASAAPEQIQRVIVQEQSAQIDIVPQAERAASVSVVGLSHFEQTDKEGSSSTQMPRPTV